MGKPFNEARFLLELQMTPRPPRTGLAAPALILDDRAAPPFSSAMIETREQVDAQVDAQRGVAGRAFPARAVGSATV